MNESTMYTLYQYPHGLPVCKPAKLAGWGKATMAQCKKTGTSFLILCMLLLLASCQEKAEQKPSPTANPDLPTVGFLIYGKHNIYISILCDALQKTMEGRANLRMTFADEESSSQQKQVEAMLDSKVDGLILFLAQPKGIASFMEAISMGNVPTVFLNHEPDLAILKHHENTCFVGTLAEESGMLQGEILKKLWDAHPEYDRNNDGKFQYIMLQGPSHSVEALHRSEYSISRARELGLFMKQVQQDLICNWNEQEAFEAMTEILASGIGEIEVVISNNDSMALGAIQALAALGYNTEDSPADRFIPVIGVDAVPDAVIAIEKGVMSATVKQDPDATARAVTEILLNRIAGKGFLDGQDLEWDSSGVAIRLPFHIFGTMNLTPAGGGQP